MTSAATPRLRSGAEAQRIPCPKGGGQEELPHIQGQGQGPRAPDCDSIGIAKRSYPASEVRGSDERSYPVSEIRGIGQEELPHAPTPEARMSNPTPKARSSGREYQPHVQGAMAARAQEGLEELSHVEGQEGQR